MRRLVSLGDSFSCGEGVGLRYRPEQIWVRQLADLLGLQLGQLARPGATLHEVRRDQLPTALAAGPGAVATLFAGPNDLFHAGYNPTALHRTCAEIATALAATFDLVLIGRWHDPLQLYPMPRRLRRRVLERVGELNDAVDASAAIALAGGGRVAVVDLAGEPELAARSAWAIDRVHPSVLGHALIARAAARAVAGHGSAAVAGHGRVPVGSPGPTAGPPVKPTDRSAEPTAGPPVKPVNGSPAGPADLPGDRRDLPRDLSDLAAADHEDLSWQAECRWWARHGGPWMVRRLARRAPAADGSPPPVLGACGPRVTDPSAPPVTGPPAPPAADRTPQPVPDGSALPARPAKSAGGRPRPPAVQPRGAADDAAHSPTGQPCARGGVTGGQQLPGDRQVAGSGR